MLYEESGVNIKGGEDFAHYIKQRIKHTPGFYPDFAWGFDLAEKIKDIKDPFIVYSTDGIGTKIKLAIQYKNVGGLGKDLLAMCVNDILVLGARPIVFLDYIAVSNIKNPNLRPFMDGLLNALSEEGIELGGGETAELPDLLKEDEFDVAGFVIGVVSKNKITKNEHVKEKDVVLAIPSSGVHSNGYSLVRHILNKKNIDAEKVFIENKSLIEILLTPTRIYTKDLLQFFEKGIVHGAAHITGGGIEGNLKRTLNKDVNAIIYKDRIRVHPVFKYLQDIGDVSEDEMWRVFNMGVGFILIVSKEHVDAITKNTDAYPIGEITKGEGEVVIK